MPKMLNNLDLEQNQIQNVIVHQVAGLGVITSPLNGQIAYNTVDHKLYVYRNGAWKELGELESIALATNDENLITISTGTTNGELTFDLDTQITPVSASQFLITDADGDLEMPTNGDINVTGTGTINAPTGGITIGGITAATVDDVAAATAGLDVKLSVRLSPTVDLDSDPDISGTITYNNTGGTEGTGQITATLNTSEQWTVDGTILSSADDGTRVLLKNQTSQDQNGIWTTTISGTSLTLDRAVDFDEDGDVTANAFTWVEEGATYEDTAWVVTSDDPIVVGTALGDNIVWSQFSGPGSFTGGNGIDITASVISVDLVNTNSGLEFSSGELQIDLAANSGLTLTGGLQIDSATAGAGLALTTGVLSVNTGDGTEIVGDAVVADIDTNSFAFVTGEIALAANVAGNGIALATGVLSVDVHASGALNNNFLTTGQLGVNVDGTSIEIDTNALSVKSGGITTTEILDGTILAGDLSTSGATLGDGTVTVARKWVDTFNGADGRFNVNDIVLVHDLATTDVAVTILDENSEIVYPDVDTNTATDTTQGNEITVKFSGGSKPGAGETFTAIITG